MLRSFVCVCWNGPLLWQHPHRFIYVTYCFVRFHCLSLFVWMFRWISSFFGKRPYTSTEIDTHNRKIFRIFFIFILVSFMQFSTLHFVLLHIFFFSLYGILNVMLFMPFLAVLFHWIVRWCQLPNHHIFLPLVSNSFCVKTYTHKSDALLLILLLYYVRWFHNFSLLFVLLCHSHSIENYSFIYSDVLNLSTHILATMAFEVCHTKDQKRLMYNFWIDIKTTFIHYGAHTHTDDLMLTRMWRKL